MAAWPRLEGTGGSPSLERGRRLLLLHLSRPSWVHRRVESIELISDVSVRRRVSSDLSLPTLPPPAIAPYHGSLELVPLTVLAKRPLAAFDLRDEAGRPLPVLTREQNGLLAWELLVAAAHLELGVLPPLDVRRSLADLVVGEQRSGPARLVAFGAVALSPSIRRRLLASPLVGPLMAELAVNFLLLAPVEHEPGRRRVLKLGYTEPLERDHDDLVAQLGWAPSSLVFDLPTIDFSASYHLEVEAPSGLVIVGGEVESEGGSVGARPLVTQERLHVHVPREAQAPASRAVVAVAVPRRGLVRAATVTAWSAFVLLAVLTAFSDRIERDAHGPVAALLLLVPTVVAAYLVRPDEHGLVASLLRWGRGAVLLVSLVALSAATTVVLGPSDELAVWLAVHLGAAAIPTGALTMASARGAR